MRQVPGVVIPVPQPVARQVCPLGHSLSCGVLRQVPSTRQVSRVHATLSSQSATRAHRRAPGAAQPTPTVHTWGAVHMALSVRCSQIPPTTQTSRVQAMRSSHCALELHAAAVPASLPKRAGGSPLHVTASSEKSAKNRGDVVLTGALP
jgi:hypothetical protein